MPELWLDEQNSRVYQKSMVTGVTYQFNNPQDAQKGYEIIQKEINKCLRGRNRKPFYPDYAVEACAKAGIVVHIW